MSSSREPLRTIRAKAFGRDYFYAVSGTTRGVFTDSEGNSVTVREWQKPPAEEHLQEAACSTSATFFLTASGKVYRVGTMHGVIHPVPSLVTIPLPLKCVQIAAGRHFCLARMEGGLAVVSWGANHFGQLGLGLNENEPQITFTAQPVVIERLLPHVIGAPIVSVAAGDWHGLALCQTGRIFAWGSNRSQQCGRKPTSNQINSNAAPTILLPLPITMEGPATAIAAGRSHSVAIVKQQVYCWGSALHGQCGNIARRSAGVSPPKLVEDLGTTSITQIAAGDAHTLALSSDGKVYCWGSSSEGQLGLGPVTSAQPKPRLIADIDFHAIQAGLQWKAQQTTGTTPSKFPTVPTITKIYAGAAYSAVISSSGHLYTWGSNDVGQLGRPTPATLPFKDNYIQAPAKTSTMRDLECCTFDSNHNILLPQRVEAVDQLFIDHVACGPNHMWCLGHDRTDEEKQLEVARTLYEVQEGRRRRSLQRARDSLHHQAKLVESEDHDNESTASVSSPGSPEVAQLRLSSTDTSAQSNANVEASETLDATENDNLSIDVSSTAGYDYIESINEVEAATVENAFAKPKSMGLMKRLSMKFRRNRKKDR